LNIDLEISNERQECETGTIYVEVLVGGERVNERY
jgi:hypothetical protein